MDDLSHKKKFFCFFTIHNDISYILTIVFLCISVVLLLYGLRSYLKLRHLQNHNILLIYAFTFSWWISIKLLK